MDRIIRRLEACNHALEYAAWNYGEMKLNDLKPNVIESTGVAESCLIEVRNNNLAINKLREIQKSETGESNCTIHGVMQSALPDTPDNEIYDAAAELYKAGKMLNATLLVKRHTTMNPAQAKQYCDSHFA